MLLRLFFLITGIWFSGPPAFAGELHEAVQARALGKVKQLLAQGADPNVEEEISGALQSFFSGKTALHVALSQGTQDTDIVELLLDHGANVNAQDANGNTPLFYAARNAELAKLLLARGAHVNTGDIRGSTSLHSAVWADNVAVIRLLLAHGADIDAQDNSGVSPLSLALQRSNPEIVELFRSHEAKLNAETVFASTLLQAVKAGELAKVKELLKQGGNVNSKVHVGSRLGFMHFPPVVCISSPRRGDDANTEGQFPLYAAVTQGSRDIVELLLTHKADPNARDGVSGRTALHMAVARGSQELTALLLAHKADVNVLDTCGQTPLFYALNSVELTKLLLAQRARGNLNNAEARSLLSLALQRGHPEVVKLLRAHGADTKDGRVFTPALIEAAKTGNVEKVKELLDQGAAINDQDSGTAETALHHAAAQGHVAVVELLLDRGATVNVHGFSWGTPLHRALAGGHKQVVEILLAHGADPDAGNSGEGGMPLSSTSQSRDVKVAEMLRAMEAKQTAAAVLEAVKKGDLGRIKELVAQGADVNAMNAGQSLLSYAVSQGHKDVVEFLLSHGANVNVKDQNGETPLE